MAEVNVRMNTTFFERCNLKLQWVPSTSIVHNGVQYLKLTMTDGGLAAVCGAPLAVANPLEANAFRRHLVRKRERATLQLMKAHAKSKCSKSTSRQEYVENAPGTTFFTVYSFYGV
eukprot:TRINITY_DN5511_c0_g2_i2.p2 TRINITY_DN5511_c0_g2~~TRINITY_DN5511_c0_g2_i2.p2  ORF type:complete len:116 (+),score=11.85 TRINITY_DN5511_c0_g2_i2:136-483(+)